MKKTLTILLFAILYSASGQQPCYVGGCSSQLCTAEQGAISNCLWSPEYTCYRTATCERQSNGQCGWTSTPALRACLANPPGPCYVGGCSNQLCTDDPNAVSTCEWTDAYACYGSATCARQNDGQCGWTSTPELEACLANPPGPCYVGGCSGQLCTNDPNAGSTCEWTDAYWCYGSATCERQSNGQCGWTSTPELEACLANPPGTCYRGGCSGQLCTDSPNASNAISICEWRNEYACYPSATCERQSDGQCGWTSTPDLQECLANPPLPL